jgi:hypothetical protein
MAPVRGAIQHDAKYEQTQSLKRKKGSLFSPNECKNDRHLIVYK